MPNWYIYFRLLMSLRYNRHSNFADGCNIARTELQDVLIDLRIKSAEELRWTEQQTQDFFESMVVKSRCRSNAFTQDEALRSIAKENERLTLYGDGV
jgi:hypothetical protein